MLTSEELDESCRRCGITCLICEQGFHATMDDAKLDNPDIEPDDLLVETMYRMLDENLDFGKYSSDDGDPDSDAHAGLMVARSDLLETIAHRWVKGNYSGRGEQEIDLAQRDLDGLVAGL